MATDLAVMQQIELLMIMMMLCLGGHALATPHLQLPITRANGDSSAQVLKDTFPYLVPPTDTAAGSDDGRTRSLLATDSVNAVKSTTSVNSIQQFGPMGMGTFAQASAQAGSGFGPVMPGPGFNAAAQVRCDVMYNVKFL